MKSAALIGALFFTTGLTAFAQEPPLTVVVEGGEARVEEEPSGITPEVLKILTEQIERRAAGTPFEHAGRIRLTLRDPLLTELEGRLEAVDPEDHTAVERAIERAIQVAGPPEPIEGGNNRLVIGQNLSLEEDEPLDSLLLVGSTLVIHGRIGHLFAIGSQVRIAGDAEIEHGVLSLGSEIEAAPEADVSAQEIHIQLPGSREAWEVFFQDFAERRFDTWPLRLLGALATFLSGALLGWIYLLIAPRVDQAARTTLAGSPGLYLGIGLLGWIAFVPLALVLILSAVGIVLVPVVVLVAGVLTTLGHFVAAGAIGTRLLAERTAGRFATFLLGLLIVQLVALIPWVGPAIVLVFTAAGFGAVLKQIQLAILNQRRETT